MKNLISYSCFVLVILMAACSDSKMDMNYAPASEKSYAESDGYVEEREQATTYDVQTVSNEGGEASRITDQTKVKPKIIRDASMRMQVETYKTARTAINEAIAKHEAYVTVEDESKSGYSWENNMVIRVSSEKFDALLEDLTQLAIYTDHKRINAKDVTAEYIDIESRLENRKKVEKRFQEILQQAKNIKEILDVENEIRKIREEIDAAEGRLKYLRDQVSFSTINLTYYQKLDYEAAPERSYFTKVGKAVGEGWDGFLEFTIAILYAWPFWILLVAVVWLVRGWWKKRKKV